MCALQTPMPLLAGCRVGEGGSVVLFPLVRYDKREPKAHAAGELKWHGDARPWVFIPVGRIRCGMEMRIAEVHPT